MNQPSSQSPEETFLQAIARISRPEIREGLTLAKQVSVVDPEMALTRLRTVLEFILRDVHQRVLSESSGTKPLENVIQRLRRDGHLPGRIAVPANFIREHGNLAAHTFEGGVSVELVDDAIRQLMQVVEWYEQNFGSVNSMPILKDQEGESAGEGEASSANGPNRELQKAQEKRRRRILWTLLSSGIAVSMVLGVMLIQWPVLWSDLEHSDIPDPLKGLAAEEVLKIAYGSPAPPATGTKPEISVCLRAKRDGAVAFEPILNGATLESLVDHYVIELEPKTTGYLYVFQVDTAGNKTWLFPKNNTFAGSTGMNPVVPRSPIRIPEEGGLFLDNNIGLEHVYFVFAASPWHELEKELGTPRNSAAYPSTTLALDRGIQSPLNRGTRGVGGVASDTSTVEKTQLKDSVFPASLKAESSLLVFERWFRHR